MSNAKNAHLVVNHGIGPLDSRNKLDSQGLIAQAQRVAPEAFDPEDRILSPVGDRWATPMTWTVAVSPMDGRDLGYLPQLGVKEAALAVEAAAREHLTWGNLSIGRRAKAVAIAAELLKANRELLAEILAWEIGKTLRSANIDVDRCISGIEWYLGEIAHMSEGRQSIGLVSNIASWNYPFSVLLLNVLVQALCGNSVIAKIPSRGGGISLTLAFALLRRARLPVSLVGGRGKDLSEPLVAHPMVSGLAFVGGRTNGAEVSKRLRRSGKRYALEMEGVNAYAITAFSQWDLLGKQIRAGFDFGKQRCTAYTRWVVERDLVPSFLETYTDIVKSLHVGNPFIDPNVDFGPLISAGKVNELRGRIEQAKQYGATIIYEGELSKTSFVPGQDTSAYLAPILVLGAQAPSDLYHREPFGPVDMLIPVDSDEELIAEANVSQGALVASVASDDVRHAEQIADQLQAFKVAINRLRSRGDRLEPFGGLGGSWEGSFAGGANLVHAFTDPVNNEGMDMNSKTPRDLPR